jgi:HK97 family phage major capsid protein
MSIAQKIRSVSTNIDTNAKAAEFVMLMRCLIGANGNRSDAVKLAEAAHATDRVVSILRSPVASGDTETSGWASQLAPETPLSQGFVATLPRFSATDTILAAGDFARMPLRTRAAVASTAAKAGAIVSPLAAAPLSSMTFTSATLEPVLVSGMITLTDELVLAVSTAAFALLADEVRKAIGLATDEQFLALITNGTGVNSAGSTGLGATQIVADLLGALNAVDIAKWSKPYWIIPTVVAKKLLMLRDSGGWLFGGLLSPGAEIQGIPVAITDAVSTMILLVDAANIAFEQEALEVDVARDASIMLDDSPTSGQAFLASAFQNGFRVVRARRWFGAELLRSDGASIITGIA